GVEDAEAVELRRSEANPRDGEGKEPDARVDGAREPRAYRRLRSRPGPARRALTDLVAQRFERAPPQRPDDRHGCPDGEDGTQLFEWEDLSEEHELHEVQSDAQRDASEEKARPSKDVAPRAIAEQGLRQRRVLGGPARLPIAPVVE